MKICCGYSFEVHQRGASNEYHNMFCFEEQGKYQYFSDEKKKQKKKQQNLTWGYVFSIIMETSATVDVKSDTVIGLWNTGSILFATHPAVLWHISWQ